MNITLNVDATEMFNKDYLTVFWDVLPFSLVSFYYYIPEVCHLDSRHRESLKCHEVCVVGLKHV
jgi:hypothetical protein